uniref:hypothetical protein n=1 Tax=uncultured Caulobacter sp. TaxID=158749 RepID=UPI0025D0A4DD
GVRSTFAAPDELDIPPALASAPAIRGRTWTFRPTYFCSNSTLDLRGVAQLVMAAARSGGATNTFGTARNNDLPCDVIDPTVSQDAAPGDRRITVVMGGGQMEGGVLAIVNQRRDCYRFKRGVLCGRDLGGIAGLEPMAPGQLAPKVQLLSVRLDQPLRSPILGEGWSKLDPGGKGVWTLAHKATFTLTPPATLKPGPFNVDIVAIGFSDQPLRPQPVTLYAEGRRLETQAVDPKDFILYRFTAPKDVVKPGQPIRFTLDIPQARVSSMDPRMLGVAVQEIRLAQ